MNNKPHPSQAELLEYFYYDVRGDLYPKDSEPKDRKPLQDWRNYRNKRYNGQTYRLHRLIYIYWFGEIPDNWVVDHIDGDRDNNKFSNLRACSKSWNNWWANQTISQSLEEFKLVNWEDSKKLKSALRILNELSMLERWGCNRIRCIEEGVDDGSIEEILELIEDAKKIIDSYQETQDPKLLEDIEFYLEILENFEAPSRNPMEREKEEKYVLDKDKASILTQYERHQHARFFNGMAFPLKTPDDQWIVSVIRSKRLECFLERMDESDRAKFSGNAGYWYCRKDQSVYTRQIYDYGFTCEQAQLFTLKYNAMYIEHLRDIHVEYNRGKSSCHGFYMGHSDVYWKMLSLFEVIYKQKLVYDVEVPNVSPYCMYPNNLE